MRKLCIDVFSGFTYDELLPMAKAAGFDGFFSGEVWAGSYDDMKKAVDLAKSLELFPETSHSTIPGCTTIWLPGGEGEDYVDVLKKNIDNCHKLSVPILVVHIQLDKARENNLALGLSRLEAVIEYAKERNVKIAFENINSTEYLFAAMDKFPEENVGFCYDCGHEACHTPGVRFLPILGKRLICTHLHDNDEKNDCHFIPFEGKIDFERIAGELKACDYQGNLTLEVQYEYRLDKGLTKEEFIKKSFEALKKLCILIEN